MQTQNIIKNLENRSLKYNDFNSIERRREILSSLSRRNLLGRGAVGNVYRVGGYAVKEVSPCRAKKDSALYKYCEDLKKTKNKEFPKIPGGNGKHRYMLPNLFSETVLGMVLGKEISFTPTYNSYLRGDNVYIVMQAQNTVISGGRLNPLLNNTKSLLYLLFQVSHALLTAQQKYRFTHYDLHIENLLYKNNRRDISYPLPNSNKRVVIEGKNCPFIIQISDFALGRLELDNVIVSPSIDQFPVKSYGEFHPSYDILSLLGAILIDNKYRRYFNPLFFSNLDLYRFMLLFLLWILNEKELKVYSNMGFSALQQIRDAIGNKYYGKITTAPNKFIFRPKTDGDFIPYSQTKSTVQITNFLGEILLRKGYLSLESFTKRGNTLHIPRLPFYKEYNVVERYMPEIPLLDSPGRRETVGDFVEMDIDEFVKVRSYHILANVEPKSFNFTIEPSQLQTCPIQEHYLTAIFVKQGYQSKYKFAFDCCKLDPANYLLQNNKTGFTMNGTFFSIKEEFVPIGLYEDKNSLINKYKVPPKYKDVFRYVILENNILKIRKNVKRNTQIFTTGPVLIENGVVVFNPNETRFDCTDEKHAGKTMIKQTENTITTSGYYQYKSVKTQDGFTCAEEFVKDVKTYPRCDAIRPGELSHADNPNPRSVFCILRNGDYIFITVEGRARRGIGFDLYSLARTINKSFPDVVSAINLDGGRSSNMAWRSKRYPDKVFISNPDHLYPYPVGNILTFTN